MSTNPLQLLKTVAGPLRTARSAVGRYLLLPFVAGTELPHLSGSSSEPLTFRRDGWRDGFVAYRDDLVAALGSARRRLWALRSFILLLRTLLLAASVWLVGVLLGMLGLADQPLWLSYLVGGVLAAGLFLILRQQLSYFDVARVVDRQLGLKAQLGTAIQLSRDGEPSQLARTQVRQAIAVARQIEPSQAVALRPPWRDLRLLALVVVATLSLSFAASLGLRVPLPDPALGATLEAAEREAPTTWYDVDPAAVADVTTQEKSASSLQNRVDDLRRQLNQNEITPEEYASEMAAVEDQLREAAEESNRQQAALSELAEALKDNSATRGIAEDINRGEYVQAVQDMSNLSSQTGQLSEQARQELAKRLGEVAKQTAQSNPALSAAADRASQALQQGDQASAEQALSDLASEMASASQSVVPQSEMGDALQQLQQAQQDAVPNSGQPGDSGRLPEMANSPGQPNGSQPGEMQQAQTGQGPKQGDQGQRGDSSSAGGGAGSGRGERIVSSDPNQSKPEVTGNVLKLTGKPSGSGVTVRSQGNGNEPLTNTSSGTASVSGGGSRSNDPVNAVGEQNLVPLDMKPVVRDYFSGNGN